MERLIENRRRKDCTPYTIGTEMANGLVFDQTESIDIASDNTFSQVLST